MIEKKITLRDVFQQGLIAAVITLSVSVIGMVELFGQRDLIFNIITVGQVLVYSAPVILAYMLASKMTGKDKANSLLYGTLIGVITALPLIGIVWLSELFNIRDYFVNISPAMVDLITFETGPAAGSFVLLFSMAFAGLLGAAFFILPSNIAAPILSGFLWMLILGMLAEVLTERLRTFFGNSVARLVFTSKALRLVPALVIFGVAAGLKAWSVTREKPADRPSFLTFRHENQIRWPNLIATVVALLILPLILGTYLSEVANNVGIYILMGLGLNIVVGFAGLLDLGYVAFFAIGAYMMAVLTSTGDLGMGINFWVALPFCVIVSVLAGIILGVPVLRMRGDYLAIVTLGFGEIIEKFAKSDLLKPYIGGAQGILNIPKPSFFGVSLVKPELLYYVVLAGVLLAAFVSWRMRDSRLGRQWMAMREDETVAEAMGINLVATKLLAFGAGAAFSGLAGAIFASKLTSIFPHSFKLLISINVLSLIIVGGIGSLPGVAVGAAILIGLPELLREFAEHRMLIYGALLIVMMLAKPEGFVPSEVHKRELRAGEEQPSPAEAD